MTTASRRLAGENSKVLRQQGQLVVVLGIAAFLVSALPLTQFKLPQNAYLPLHTILEFVSVAVAFMVFATIWHAPKGEVTFGQLLIALSLFCGGWLDLFHALSFKGMPDFLTPSSFEKGIDFWLAARLIIAVTVFMVSLGRGKSVQMPNVRCWMLAFATLIVAAVTVAILFFQDQLPSTYIDGQGVTPIKTALEAMITLLFILAAGRYFEIARKQGAEAPALLFGAITIAALSEQFFMSYSDVRDLKNLAGHLYKILCYTLIYRAVLIANVRRPYELLKTQTDRLMQANALLRKQSLALESTSTSVFLTDRDGNLQWSNRASINLLTSSQNEEQDLSLFAAPITPLAEQANEIRKKVMSGNSWSGMVEISDASERRFMFHRVVSPLLSASGAIEGFVSVSEDVTECVQAVEWNKRVLETAIDGFILLDESGPDGTILSVNPAYTAMSGFAAEELIGKRFIDIETVHTQEQIEANRQKIRRHGFARFETRHRKKNGEDFEVEVALTFDPEMRKTFTFVRDLSAARASENSRRDLERQLQQSQKMEAFGQLTGGIAHDFNNILTSILGYSKLAQKKFATDLDSKLAKYLQEIVASTERARDLIARMMVYTRETSSQFVEEIAPGVVVKEVVAMVRPSITAGIQMSVHTESDERIRMDEGELNQMLVNLVVNARDAIGELGENGSITLRVRSYITSGQICAITQEQLFGRFVAVEVQDTGSGIAASDMPKLFDPFFTTKDVGKGTGLGLSMVQGIVRRAKGHVLVDSTPGRGSVFRLLFSPVLAPAPIGLRQQQGAPEIPRGDGQHIWVVDDEPAIGGYFEELLEDHGYRVSKFSDPAEVITRIQRDGVACDLLITDKTMPGASGYELASEMRRLKPDLPVILCTGDDRGPLSGLVTPANIHHTFIKPVLPEDILEAVAKELSLPQGA